MKVEIIARETIKPSSPTPNHRRSFKLSLLDQLATSIHTSLVLFYRRDEGGCEEVSETSRCLKESLSQTLTHFYPFAGRVKDHVWVDCNDDGVEYLEARVDSPLSDVLGQPELETIEHFVPIPTEVKGPLLLVQANFFQCGGIALGVRISHKLADAATFTTLITGWANIARGFCDAVSLDFSAATLFPPRDDLCPVHPIALDNLDRIIQNCITRRYVFDGSKVAALKSKSTSESVTQPSRVEAVTALLWSVIAASKSRLASQRSSSLIWAANLRPRLMPPLPEQSFGNLSFPMLLHANEGETDLSCFVCHLKRGIAELRDNFGKTLDEEEKLSLILDHDMKIRDWMHNMDDLIFYIITSWCKFPLYEADFGWGKPTWVSIGNRCLFPNFVTLVDTSDGNGIEAWVTLTEEHMAVFETDPEFLTFGSVNPSVLN
ncbi:vinorine synthase-like [Actinidia eriantha]|uniref:vinorine synthase-like n=1 Tax=Actinidia eriantha TaxID=165200 RepID=UPI002585F317|nr:vinorine synthase-like [Actinidia eriantha]XP_057504753.1 vinorine synthase-like [Actinidia eriantha]